MKLTIDTEAKTLLLESGDSCELFDLYSKAAFERISREWVRVGWNQKHQYTFSWFGRPIIQLPEDMIRLQEVIFNLKPDVIIETGIAHGGSLVYYASLFEAMGKGRVVGVDIEIRQHNRDAIEGHPLSDRITMVEGSSTDKEVLKVVESEISKKDTVLVILDSNHSYRHVYSELEVYSELVTIGSYIVATDGIMCELTDVPRGQSSWATDNPRDAARDFADKHNEFRIEQPAWLFNESALENNITHWPGAWLRRLR